MWPFKKKPAPSDGMHRASASVAGNVDEMPEFVRIIPSSQATDLGTYAMMKAFETGKPVAVYEDDLGVWRDSETDEVIERA